MVLGYDNCITNNSGHDIWAMWKEDYKLVTESFDKLSKNMEASGGLTMPGLSGAFKNSKEEEHARKFKYELASTGFSSLRPGAFICIEPRTADKK